MNDIIIVEVRMLCEGLQPRAHSLRLLPEHGTDIVLRALHHQRLFVEREVLLMRAQAREQQRGTDGIGDSDTDGLDSTDTTADAAPGAADGTAAGEAV